MPKRHKPRTVLFQPRDLAPVTIPETIAAIDTARDAEHDLDRIGDDIAILEAWLADPAYARMRSSLIAGINRRRDQRVALMLAPIPITG